MPALKALALRTTTSRLTSKYQATVPALVRETLGLDAGDTIAFDVEHNAVRLRKARPLDLAFARALEHTLQEWTSQEDDVAYRDL